jgi:sugar-specific transcriptional regulator TrmB
LLEALGDVNLALSPIEVVSDGVHDLDKLLDPLKKYVDQLDNDLKKKITIPSINAAPFGTIKSFKISIDDMVSLVKKEIKKIESKMFLPDAEKYINKAVQKGVNEFIAPIKDDIKKTINKIEKKSIQNLDKDKLKNKLSQLEGNLFSSSLPDFSDLENIVPDIKQYLNGCENYGK